MRLGAQEAKLANHSLARLIYGEDIIKERHRHRYEFNNSYRKQFNDAGMKFSGVSMDDLVEVIELPSHKWFVGCQFHPEFTSTPRKGHPLFAHFVESILESKKSIPMPKRAAIV